MKPYNHLIKYSIGLCIVLGARMLPHPPNIEPIMATTMPFAKKWGWLAGMVFSTLAIVCYDALTSTIGIWTLFTASTYAIIGICAGIYFANRANSGKEYVKFAIIATIVYDAITGISTGVLFFEQQLILAMLGQIPFTAYHLLGNITFAYVVSPLLYEYILDNPELNTSTLWHKLTSA